MRDGRAAYSRHELGAHFDNSGMFGFGSHHEACYVVQEDDGGVSVRQLGYRPGQGHGHTAGCMCG